VVSTCPTGSASPEKRRARKKTAAYLAPKPNRGPTLAFRNKHHSRVAGNKLLYPFFSRGLSPVENRSGRVQRFTAWNKPSNVFQMGLSACHRMFPLRISGDQNCCPVPDQGSFCANLASSRVDRFSVEAGLEWIPSPLGSKGIRRRSSGATRRR